MGNKSYVLCYIDHLSNKKIALCQVFLILTLGSCDMDPNIHSLLAGYISNISEFWGRLSGSDISNQVKAIEVAETCSEEAT